jgi:prepilin-type N-terminal cleavage/methylation domain-containing protein
MKRLRQQDGLTLTELLVAMLLMGIVFGAVLTVLEVGLRQVNNDQKRNENQDNARTAIDRLVHDLRNVASPTAGSAGALEQAGAYDLVFQTVSSGSAFGGSNASNQMRVRYCLDASTPSNETLWLETQTWTTSTAPTIPSTSSCPGPLSGWPTQYRLVTNVSNEIEGQNRAVFTYGPTGASGTSQITTVNLDLFLNPVPGGEPGETELQSGINLRNSNAPPVASFTAATPNHDLQLNASSSEDPNGQALTYQWSIDGATIAGATTQQYDAGTGYSVGSTHTVGLTVSDGVLSASTTQSVKIS